LTGVGTTKVAKKQAPFLTGVADPTIPNHVNIIVSNVVNKSQEKGSLAALVLKNVDFTFFAKT